MGEIDHVHFLCADPERTALFFREHFGATEVARIRYPDWLIIRLQMGSTLLALSPRRAGEVLAELPPGPRRGFYHLGIRVKGIEALVERLRSAGAPVVGEPRDLNARVRVAYVVAPDGIELELLEPLETGGRA